jgi:site-specific recombinase XerD
MMHTICSNAGVTPHSNHILHGQYATALFEAGFDVEQVMERTGHNSVKATIVYNQTSDMTHQKQCDALTPHICLLKSNTNNSFN